ncbi:MAG: transcriptional repressor [Proteobacteria bacterium]|jgi:Fur family peroxide stress response transcriptional regulator|nr:transcriptional repressor [Pseudomonadota bacterium]
MSLPNPATDSPASTTGTSLASHTSHAKQLLELHPLKKGLRQTEQRKAVFEALMSNADHPSAVDVFMRVKNRMPTISLATVYNCLETLTENGLVRAVNHEREPSRFCANLQEHAHLFCSQCASVTDIPLHTHTPPEQVWKLPTGITITQQEVSFRGLCAKCASTQNA